MLSWLLSNTLNKADGFQLTVNNNHIERTNIIKYLGVHLDDKLSWKIHIKNTAKRLSKTCNMTYKLRHYVPISTLKKFYYSKFHSVLQYSLINWGRTCLTHLHKIEALQNEIIRACLFRPQRYPTRYTQNLVFCV